MGLDGQLQHLRQYFQQPGLVPLRPVGQARQVQGHILQGRVAHFPGLFGILKIMFIQLEAQPAAFGNLGRVAAVKDKIGIPHFRCHLADVLQEVFMPLGGKKLLGDVNQGLGEKERPAGPVPAAVDVKKRPDKALGQPLVVAVGLAGIFTPRPDGRHLGKMLGNLPVEVEVAENRLAAPSHGQLGEFIDHHLGQLPQLPVIPPFQVGSEKEVDRIPADGPGKMALQRRREFQHVVQQHLGMFGRPGHGQGIGQAQAEFLDVFQRLAAAVGTVNESQVMEVQIAPHVGVTDILRKNPQQGIFLLDVFRQGQVGGFRAVGHIGIFPVGVDNQLFHVINRHPQAGVHDAGLFQAHFYQLGIHHFTDQGSGNEAEIGGKNRLLHGHADLFRRRLIEVGLPEQGLRDPAPVPAGNIFPGGPHLEQGHVRGFPTGRPTLLHHFQL